MKTIITTRRALSELPPYSVIVSLDDDTDVRVKTSTGSWSVSGRFTDTRFQSTEYLAAYFGVMLIHRPVTR